MERGVPSPSLVKTRGIRASTRAGFLIAEMGKNGQRRPRGKSHVGAHDMSPKLSDLGISRDQSSQWQQLAGIEPEEIDKRLPVMTRKREAINIRPVSSFKKLTN
jgi:hypothetical protein